MNYSGPLIRFTVYPGGIVMKPIFLAPLAVPASEITAVRLKREWWAKGVEIAHTSSHVASPIFLHCPEDHPFVTALRTIAPMGAGRDVR